MKPSNKYILIFLAFAWLTLIASMLISHQAADYDSDPVGGRQLINHVDTLASFSVVKIEQAGKLRIHSSVDNQLVYHEYISKIPPEVPAIKEYEVKQDTLFITNLRQADNGGFLLQVNNMRHLIVQTSEEISLEYIAQDSLLISRKSGNVLITDRSSFNYLHIESPGKFDLGFTAAKELDLKLRKDQLEVAGQIGGVAGIVSQNAELIVPNEIGTLTIDASNNGILTRSAQID